jgi:hypothetical protein
MSALIHPTEGRIYVLNRWSPGGNFWVWLFKNNFTITAATVYSDLTPADFAGYSAQFPTWSAAADDGAGNGERHPPTLTFSFSSGSPTNTIYGVACSPDNAGIVSKLLVAVNLTTPKVMASPGDSLVFDLSVLQGQY